MIDCISPLALLAAFLFICVDTGFTLWLAMRNRKRALLIAHYERLFKQMGVNLDEGTVDSLKWERFTVTLFSQAGKQPPSGLHTAEGEPPRISRH